MNTSKIMAALIVGSLFAANASAEPALNGDADFQAWLKAATAQYSAPAPKAAASAGSASKPAQQVLRVELESFNP